MNYTPGTLWAIYLVVVLVTFIIIALLCGFHRGVARGICYSVSLLTALIVGAVVVMIGSLYFDLGDLDEADRSQLRYLFVAAGVAVLAGLAITLVSTGWLDPDLVHSQDRTWIVVMLLVALAIPALLYYVWVRDYQIDPECEQNMLTSGKFYVEKTVHCNRDTGECHIKKRKIFDKNGVTKVIYSSDKLEEPESEVLERT